MTHDYVVATHSFLVHVTLDDDHDIVDHRLLHGTGHHYGIGLEPDGTGTFLAKHRSTELMRFRADEPYDRMETIPFPGRFKAVHQIAVHNGGVYLANSHYNSLVYRTLDGSVQHEYVFNGIDEDVNHVNSVFPCGDQVFALLNNRGKRPSEVAVLHHGDDGFTLTGLMMLWHTGCHNILLHDGILYYNASAAGRVVAVDLDRQRIIREVEFPGHTKGMSLRGDELVIGYSDVAAREARRTSRGHLAVLRAGDLEVIRGEVDLNLPSLPHPIGNVNEVRCLSGGELGHARATALDGDWGSIRLARSGALSWLRAVGNVSRNRVQRRLAESRRSA